MNRNKQGQARQAIGEGPTGLTLPWRTDILSEGIRVRVREAIWEIMSEELDAVLGAGPYERTDARRGYRNGSRPRELTTSQGVTEFDMPRGVLWEGGKEVEWQSTVLPRYQRRAARVDGALLGMYFGGVNTRKVKQAIKILFKGAPLSRSTISRIIGKLKVYFEAWQKQDLSEMRLPYLYMDGIYVKVRCGGRVGAATGVGGGGHPAQRGEDPAGAGDPRRRGGGRLERRAGESERAGPETAEAGGH